jgi:hypothetical protein
VVEFELRIEFYYDLGSWGASQSVFDAVDFAGAISKSGFQATQLPRAKDALRNPVPFGGATVQVSSVEHLASIFWSDGAAEPDCRRTPQAVVVARTGWPGDSERERMMSELESDGWSWASGNQIAW